MLVQPKPYRLKNTIQHYAWGTRGADAFIPRLLSITPKPGTPYAELWLGAHPKAPSLVDIDVDTLVPLDQWIAHYPDAILGQRVSSQFDCKLPFLTKVLSAGESLSIQAHPNKTQAESLHALDPEHYADDNHKPEIAVALDELAALMGFKPYHEILGTLERYPELADFLGTPQVTHMHSAADQDLETQKERTHMLFDVLINRSLADPDSLNSAIDTLARRLRDLDKDEVERRFLNLYQKYGSDDVGLLAFLLFNLVHLKQGEALYTPAGVPHAYLCGNIIECMANSDNVVRVGLTPKFKDAPTLLNIVDATPQEPQVMGAGGNTRERNYLTPAHEFELTRWSLDMEQSVEVKDRQGPGILIVIEGVAMLTWADGELLLEKGDSVLIPDVLDAYGMSAVGAPVQVFRTSVPEEGLL